MTFNVKVVVVDTQSARHHCLLLLYLCFCCFCTSHKETLREQFLAVCHTHEGADAEAVEVLAEGLPHRGEGCQGLDRLAGLVPLTLPSPGDVEQLLESKVSKRLSHRGRRLRL